MSATPTSSLLGILQHYRPASLLCVSRSEIPAVKAWLQEHPDCRVSSTDDVPLSDDLRNQRYDLAIVADQLEHLGLSNLRAWSYRQRAKLHDEPKAHIGDGTTGS